MLKKNYTIWTFISALVLHVSRIDVFKFYCCTLSSTVKIHEYACGVHTHTHTHIQEFLKITPLQNYVVRQCKTCGKMNLGIQHSKTVSKAFKN